MIILIKYNYIMHKQISKDNKELQWKWDKNIKNIDIYLRCVGKLERNDSQWLQLNCSYT